MVKRTKMNNKAQMKIQQMAFMLIAVTLFFGLIGLAFVGFTLNKNQESASDLEAKNAKLLVSRLSNSPEFSCGEAFGSAKSNCVDMDKIMKLKEKEEQYLGFWGVASIMVRKIYPKMADTICTDSNYPDCNIVEIRPSIAARGTAVPSFVSLCRKASDNGQIYDRCEMGLLMVSYELKR